MPNVIGIDHIYITVTNVEHSTKFYDQLMAILGFRKGTFTLNDETHVQYYNRHFSYVLRPAHANNKYDPYALGLHHFCMRVENEAEVLEVANMLKEKGIEVSEPKLYPEYAFDYFSVFVTDPDGIYLEITNFRQERRERHDNWEHMP